MLIFYKIYSKTLKIALKTTILSLILCFFQANSYAKTTKLEEKFNIEVRKNTNYLIAQYKDWSVHKTKLNNKKICFALSRPIASAGNVIKNAKSYFVVTDLITDADEIMVSSGFHYKNNTDIEISFGKRKFYLFAHKTRGWAYSKNDDLDIIKQMQQNGEFIIKSFSKNNKISEDRYSLIGFKKAYFKLKEECKK